MKTIYSLEVLRRSLDVRFGKCFAKQGGSCYFFCTMNTTPWKLYGLLGVTIVAVFVLIFNRSRHDEIAPEHGPETQPAAESKPRPTAPEATIETVVPADSVRRDEPVSEADMTPFLRSEIAEKWQRELGYTQAEIAAAQRDIRAQRYPEETVNDPGVIMRHLPPRHMGQVTIERVVIASTAAAGAPIPFSISGTAPSPSFQFTHFDILVQGEVIRVRARGNADGNTTEGKGGPVTLDGTMDPLPPGDYRIEIAELGPMGSFPFTVVE
jgi:hypothetical protein